ncbi:hypothetical protein GF351_02550 [Candidatus Woesearchaeota archaeon]|nr:hypothetical protein [Candidatus Woesearchaeota archaeon]
MQARKITLFLFLLSLFVFLSAYIGLQIVQYYRSATSYAGSQTPESVRCVGFFFDVKDVRYAEGDLSLTFKNKLLSEDDIRQITVETSDSTRTVNVTAIRGNEVRVRLEDFEITGGNITVYPYYCSMFAESFMVQRG